MPRPKTKEELLFLSQKNYTKLLDFIETLPEHQLHNDFPKGYLNRNISDVLAHLHHWHLMLLGWYSEGLDGSKPKMPAEGYTWKTLPDLNRKIQEKYQEVSLRDARDMLNDSFQKVYHLIKSNSESDLFEKKKFNWTGTTSLAAYLISATSSHYDWAYKLIKKCTKIQTGQT